MFFFCQFLFLIKYSKSMQIILLKNTNLSKQIKINVESL
jgi:hypothetical protein